MDLSLTSEQEDLRDTVGRFVRDEIGVERIVADSRDDVPIDPGLWRSIAELGWLAMVPPVAGGGLGANATDVGVLFEELGKGPALGPLLESAVLTPHLLTAIESRSLTELVAGPVMDGDQIATVVLAERPGLPTSPGTAAVRWRANRHGVVLGGRALSVPEASSATHALVLAAGEQPEAPLVAAWVDLGWAGVSVKALGGFAPRQYAVEFHDVEVVSEHCVELSADTEAAVAAAVLRTVPALCAFQVGSCSSVYQMTVDYSRERKQFGRTIGSFQRVQDHVINLANAMDSARWTTAFALSKLDHDPDTLPREAIHVAKSATAESHTTACHASHEVHAGIGSDLQYTLAAHTFQSRTLFAYLGDPAWHRARLAALLGLGGQQESATT